MFLVELHHASKIDRADNVNVVQKKGLVPSPTVIQKKPRSLLQPTTGIQQHVLARHFNPHTKVVVCLQVIDNHIAKVMYVDDHFTYSELAQTGESDFKHRSPRNLHQRFRTIVSERTQPCPQAGRENHRFHEMTFSTLSLSSS